VTVAPRSANTHDLAALAALARRSFFDAYCETDDHAVIEEYCARNFTQERFASILADPRARLVVATDGGGGLVGYAHVADSPPPPCVRGAVPVELVRLYLAREWIGRGVGAALMLAAIDEARSLGGQTLWLGVYERNPRAIAFYRRFGMQVVGTKPWEWGGSVFQDPVMQRGL
jgi:GNAT superfamily N-acetyltransferase